MRLAGKIALITGAGTGIGQAAAIRFAEEGADIIASNLELSEAEATVASVKKLGRRAAAIAADISKPDETYAMVAGALDAFGGIHILVNNAGVGALPASTFELRDMEAWDNLMAINVRAAFICSQQVAYWMKEHGGGKIVNVASQTAVSGNPGINAYGPSKAALINMTRNLAVEWAEYGINVNCVAPSWTRTRRLEKAIEKGITSLEEIQKRCPFGRPAEPEEVADAILFLASDESKFITGVTLPVDGGWLAYGCQTL